ncbi:intermembrane transport protein PqiB [Marinobacter salicampi]|uniref:PqiB family protein n=1 Tax=Marinobacter salicampi TaxID=435907 RepID=UPI00140C7773|nr:MlaD family protein [Marinobacter salicampi]
MTDENTGKSPGQPELRKRGWHISLVWLVPLVAGLIGLSMLVRVWQDAGPVIEVTFETAEGLTPGETPVQYRNVVIGGLTNVKLNDDRSKVIATIQLDGNAEAFTREDSRFWVVRPRIGVGGVSGLDTLITGGFIAADPGSSAETTREFTGLETPPTITYGEPGKRFGLQAGDLGSLSVGSPVYYRKVQVGQVVSYGLSDDGSAVNLEVFVSSPHDRFVTSGTRFWNASGIEVDVSTEGLEMDVQSLVSLVTGGIAFGRPDLPESSEAVLAEAGDSFRLFDNRDGAFAADKGRAQRIRMQFDQSLRGMSAGAPVDFMGKNIGEVNSITLDYDPADQSFPVIVEAEIYPKLMGQAYDKLQAAEEDRSDETATRKLFERFVQNGLRAEARSQSLITGKLFISLEFYPNADDADFMTSTQAIIIPTRPTSLDQLQAQLLSLVERLSELPVESIGANLDGGLAEMREAMAQFNSDLLPATRSTLEGIDQVMARMEDTLNSANETLDENSPARHKLGQALGELERMSRSVRELTDYLRRHPEALLRGRQGQDRSLQP